MVIVAFPPGEKYAVNYTTLDQYDYGQILRIQGLKLPKTVEVHFSTQETGGTSITRVGVTKDGVTDVLIPDSVLENGDTTQNYSIFAFVYITDATSGKTEYRAKLEVKARPKPEVPGGGDNPDIFHEAVLEVRKSAEKAEEAQRQAEGWAHGREDLPERAEDNAKHYSDKASEDAKKTAEDRKEVERLVESVSGIDEQVAKVEKLSKNAQEAATQAGTSAEQAELHKQAAETASSAAQTAAQETEADKVSVEKLSAQVQKNKESVDKTAQDFALNTQQALADVNNAGQAQTERVQTAGTTAVENIKTAQNTATRAVETAKAEAVKAITTAGTTETKKVTDEGAKQVQTVQSIGTQETEKVTAEGTKQVGLVKTEGEKHLAAVQAAAQEIIADREQIQKNKTDISDLRQKKADAIVETASGTLLNVKDSSNAFFEDFSMRGKSEQVQTTGKNLFNVDNIIQKTMPDGKTYWGYLYVLDAGDYTISCLNPNNYNGKTDYLYCGKLLNGEYSDNGIIYVVANGFPQTKKITIEQSEELVFFNATQHNESDSKEKFAKYLFQLEKGASATTYEPYTGGKPSPSSEYPQEITNCGEDGTIDLKIAGDNAEPQTLTIPTQNGLPGLKVDGNGNYTDENGQQWIADEIDLARGKYVQRIGKRIFDGTEAWEKYKENQYSLPKWADKKDKMIAYTENKYYLCNIARIKNKDSVAIGEFNTHLINQGNGWILFGFAGTLEEWKQYLTTKKTEGNPVTVQYILAEPVETDLPPEIIAAFKKLHTNYPTTIVTNSEDTEMELSYVADTKNYTDRKIEEAVSAQTQNLANLLSLMPLSTQAAMIEADTNNILDNMEVQK